MRTISEGYAASRLARRGDLAPELAIVGALVALWFSGWLGPASRPAPSTARTLAHSASPCGASSVDPAGPPLAGLVPTLDPAGHR